LYGRHIASNIIDFLFFTCVSLRVAQCRIVDFVGWGVGDMWKFVEELQINCGGEKNGFCVLWGRDFCESYADPFH